MILRILHSTDMRSEAVTLSFLSDLPRFLAMAEAEC